MPEPNYLSMYALTPEPAKTSSIIKQSCGIGDTDGFPAFDVDSDAYATKDDSKWGFLITGGAEFHMPLTVFQVTPDGLADKGGICLGDIILEINEEDASHLTLTQAHQKIDASAKKIFFLVKSMDDEEHIEGYEPGEERSIILRVPKPVPPPPVSAIEKRLQDLQRKLSEIAEIPRILSSTLATVTQTFDKLTTNMPSCQHLHDGNEYYQYLYDKEQKRKLSYDEDVYDYELSEDDFDDDDDVDDKSVKEEEFDAKQAYLQLKLYAARQRKSKDATPESDYASENNYPLNEKDEEELDKAKITVKDNDFRADDDDDDKYDDYNICDMYDKFKMSVLKTPSGHASKDESETEEEAEHVPAVVEVEESVQSVPSVDEDFLTTTFTWNLRNKPKLQMKIGDNNVSNLHDMADNTSAPQQMSLNRNHENISLEQVAEKSVEQKLDKLERFWPWADREKIIYKQSTCHLVPHKPLGLIGQRIQLLAKRNLLEHFTRTPNPQ